MCLFVTVPMHKAARQITFSVNFSLASRPDVLSAGTLGLITRKYEDYTASVQHPGSVEAYLAAAKKSLCGNISVLPQHNLVRRCSSQFNATVVQLQVGGSRQSEDVTSGVIGGLVVIIAGLYIWRQMTTPYAEEKKQA